MQSRKYKIQPAKKIKKIAVIGGMKTAIVCAKRGHQVTLYEKSGVLGGVFIAAAAPSFKEKDQDLIAWYRREITHCPIEVKLNTEVSGVSELDADEIIVATGFTANRIPVPGIEKGIQAVDFLLGQQEVGQNVVIIGGGLTGCEIACELYLQGKNPTIVEMQNDLICGAGICLANSSYLRDFFNANKVPAPLVSKGGNIHIVGDAKKVGNLRTVIWGAWDVAMKL